MKLPLIVVLLIGAEGVRLAAADWYPKHNFSFGGGAGRPRGEISSSFTDSPNLSVLYGFRPHPNFQLEAGLDTVFGAADVRAYEETSFGLLRIRDFQYLVPFGGRAILPFAGGRAEFTGGAGAAYLHYAEQLSQPSDYLRFECFTCTSRNGWGYYGVVSLATALDRRRMFWLGITTKMYRAHTDGEPIGSLPGIRTRDRWLLLLADFSLRF